MKAHWGMLLVATLACGVPPDQNTTPATPIFATDAGTESDAGSKDNPSKSDGGTVTSDAGRPPGSGFDAGPVTSDAGQPPDSGIDAGPTYKRVFITSQTYEGDFTTFSTQGSALDAADELCTLVARGANVPGQFKAWLSSVKHSVNSRSVTADAFDRIADVGPWYQYPAGGSPALKTFNNKANLVGTALEPIRYDENGKYVSGQLTAWTGSNQFGRALRNCFGFTSSSTYGAIGMASDPTKWSYYSDYEACNNFHRLICFEQ